MADENKKGEIESTLNKAISDDPAVIDTVDPQGLEQRLLQAVVKCESGEYRSYGFVAGDAKTIVLDYFKIKSGPKILVHTLEGKKFAAEVKSHRRQHESGGGSIDVLTLANPLPIGPLELSDKQPAVGERIFSLAHWPDKKTRYEMIEVLVLGNSNSSFWVSPLAEIAMPVVNSSAQVLGVYAYDGLVLPTTKLLSEASSVGSYPGSVKAPKEQEEVEQEIAKFSMALRLGSQTGGWVEKDHGAFLFLVDFGARLWDFWSVMFRIGGAGHSGTKLLSVQGLDGEGPGVFSAKAGELILGLESKFRLLISKESRLAIQLTVAGIYHFMFLNSDDMAAFSSDPACDPLQQACSIIFRDVDAYLEDNREHGVGLQLGLDLEYYFLLLGYRFIPKALASNLPNTHKITFGFSF
jgi:hypothetical protein